jgi:hypothetical protein
MLKIYRLPVICLMALGLSTSAFAVDMESYFDSPNFNEPCGFNLTTILPSLAAAGCTTNKSSDAAREVELALCAETHPERFGELHFRGLGPVGEGGRPNCFE